ncbi:hypothetical protein CCHL11_02184 [Colletotrichum chlorophyti]|uniref:Uncharacterized protein n=1 Tax=Colletotrichum chlorophyti TaxID=708187 RepID=A0A1Q8S6N3_9PEZI|nr:hypothetical protein CCHL11_02184 [Colletotrichum chlorophyti]
MFTVFKKYSKRKTFTQSCQPLGYTHLRITSLK